MGCDIHLVIERKSHVSDQWICVIAPTWESVCQDPISMNTPDPPTPAGYFLRARNYNFFAAIAGVRGSGPDPKGLPTNISQTTQELTQEWGMDGHSHSHMPLEQFLEEFVRNNTGQLQKYVRDKLAGENQNIVRMFFPNFEPEHEYRVCY